MWSLVWHPLSEKREIKFLLGSLRDGKPQFSINLSSLATWLGLLGVLSKIHRLSQHDEAIVRGQKGQGQKGHCLIGPSLGGQLRC